MDLDSMKYADLRSLAKKLGLKANGKADKLMKAIKQHYQQEKQTELQGQCSVNVSEDGGQDGQDSDCIEASSIDVFVNTRRMRGKGSKRTITDTTESDAIKTSNVPEGVNCTPCSAQGKKKRKLSHDKDSEKTETESHPAGDEQQHPDTKDEAPAHGEAGQEKEKGPKVVKAAKIPRYKGLQQKSKTLLKPATPNFKKIHEAQFNKMESIDTYVQRKTKQIEPNRSTVKDLKDISDKRQPEGKACVKTNPTRAQPMFSPAPGNKKPAEEKGRHTLHSVSKGLQNKPAGNEVVPFRPSVLSTRRINVRFSEATCDNEFKRSLVKTPARMSLHMTSSTPQKQAADARKSYTSNFSAQKTPGLYNFTGSLNTSTTPGTQKKPSFDLKASLTRPLSYKPHKGKLKPFGESKDDASANKSLISNTRQESYKQHKVQSREDRRTKQTQDRKQKKDSMLGARRGLLMK